MPGIERKNTDLEYINKIYNYIKNDMPIETFMSKFRCSVNELKGILELCRIYGKDIDIIPRDGTFFFSKPLPKTVTAGKIGMNSDKLTHTELVNEKIYSMQDVPYEWLTRKINIIQRNCVDTHEIFINKNKIIDGLNTLKYPIYHLDFESFPCPLPRYKGENPYIQSVFQFSLHVEIIMSF